MKKLISFSVIFVFWSTILCAQWQPIFSDSISYWFSNIYFVNNDTGIVLASRYSPGYGASILRTADGGQTWNSTNFGNQFYTVHFINDSAGVIVGENESLLKTENAGISWNYISGGGPGLTDIEGSYFLTVDTGILVSRNGRVYKTDNGGNNLQTVHYMSNSGVFPATCKLVFTDSLIGFIVQSSIAKSTDRGNNWNDLIIPSNLTAKSAYFFNSNNGIAVGAKGKLSWTFDGGLTWGICDSLGPYTLYDINFISDSIGYIVGGNDFYGSPISKGIIFKTIDKGITWQIVDSTFNNGLLKLSFPSDSIGYAIGFNGLIVKIRNANSTFTSITTLSFSPKNLELFPNPCKTVLNIKGIETSPFRIFNVMGVLVMNGSLDLGVTRIDVSEFASGIYTLVIGNRTEKFIKE